MDAKNRLVLPLEIRDKLDIRKQDKIVLNFEIKEDRYVEIRLAKALGDEKSRPFSKNGGISYE